MVSVGRGGQGGQGWAGVGRVGTGACGGAAVETGTIVFRLLTRTRINENLRQDGVAAARRGALPRLNPPRLANPRGGEPNHAGGSGHKWAGMGRNGQNMEVAR